MSATVADVYKYGSVLSAVLAEVCPKCNAQPGEQCRDCGPVKVHIQRYVSYLKDD
jgi:hypothetical protein